VDSLEDSRQFADEFGLSFEVLSDANLDAVQAYGVEDPGKDIAKPATFVIQPEGHRISWIYVGDRAGDRPYWEAVLDAVDPESPATA
jgi:peroxiredoxin